MKENTQTSGWSDGWCEIDMFPVDQIMVKLLECDKTMNLKNIFV